MSARRRGAVFVLSIVSVVVVGALGVQAIRSPAGQEWPGLVAVIGLDEDDARVPVKFLGVVNPTTKAVATVPPEALVEVPGSGFLRAYHSWRLGGADLVEVTLGRLFAVEVGFHVAGAGSDLNLLLTGFTEDDVPSSNDADLRRALAEAQGWKRIDVTGEPRDGVSGALLVPNRSSVAAAASAIGGLGTKVFAEPDQIRAALPGSDPPAVPTDAAATPVPEPEPKDIVVDVLNEGNVEMAATKTAAALRAKEFVVTGIRDKLPQTRERTIVCPVRGFDAEARKVAGELGYPLEPIPDDVVPKAGAEVVVLLGHDAKV